MANTIIHYIDEGQLYSIYGSISLIVTLLLLWYFVRSNIDCGCTEGLGGIPIEDPNLMKLMPEFDGSFEYEPITLTESEDKPYKFWSGLYGDVPLSVYDIKDTAYKSEWDHRIAMYVPNMRTAFRNANTPIEATFWNEDDQSE